MTPPASGASSSLSASATPLWQTYDVMLVDLDGVVLRGGAAVPGAVDTLNRLSSRIAVAFVTNNASRPPGRIAAQLDQLGILTARTTVVTAAQAAARLVSEQVPAGANVLVVGGDGLEEALRDVGLVPVSNARERPVAVVSGLSPRVDWPLLAEGAYAVGQGLPWVASNLDPTLPTDRGVAPGNGTLVDAIATASGRRPEVAGKPEPALFREVLRQLGGHRPLVVGDRLDTDIAGAIRVQADSLLVLTGVSDLDSVASAAPTERPTFVAVDVNGLELVHPPVAVTSLGSRCGPWTADVRDGAVTVHTADLPTAAKRPEDLLRCAVCAAWRHLDSGRPPARMNGVAEALSLTMEPPQ